MNKKFKRNIITIGSWVILSLILQFSVLGFLNKYYSKGLKIEVPKEELENKKEEIIKHNIEENADDIQISPNGNYISYKSNGKMHILDVKSGKDNIVSLERSIENYFFKWNDDEDKMVIVESNVKDNKKGIKFYIYNPKENMAYPALDYANKHRTYSLAKTNMKIEDVQLNNLTTIIYFQAEYSKNNKYIYRLDISDRAIKLPLKHSNIDEFYLIRQGDEVLYKDLVSKKYFITNKSKSEELVMPTKSEYKVLTVDLEDNIYVAETAGDKVLKIFKKDIHNNKNNNQGWNQINFNLDLKLDDIVITKNNIYKNDSINNEIIDIESNSKISYDGEFVKITKKKIISRDKNTIIIKELSH